MARPFDIICFDDHWDKYQRRNKSIMLELAEREEVGIILFVEMPLTLTSLIKFLLRSTAQYTAERWQRLFSRGLVFQEGKVFVLTPLSLVPFDRLEVLQWLNIPFTKFFCRWLVNSVLKQHNLRNIVLWITLPHYTSEFVGMFGERLFCYNLCDDYTEFYDASSPLRERLEAEDRKLTAAADLMFVSSEDLERKKEAMGKMACRLSNAVDFDYFHQIWEVAVEPPDLAALHRPRLGYVGKVTHRTDLAMVERAARRHPEWSIAMIGPVSPGTEGVDRLRELPNVAFLGEKPYADVPAYLKYVDVCIMPHKVNALTESMDPLKLYSYLASGKPIVSTAVAGVGAFSQAVRVVDSNEGFVAQIEAVLEEDGSERKSKQLALARENSWSKRVDVILSLIQERLRERLGQESGVGK